MGFREREHLFPPEAVARTKAHGKGRLERPGALSWVLVDGKVAGTWSRKRAGTKLDLHVEPFARLTSAQREGVRAAAEQIGSIWGSEVALR